MINELIKRAEKTRNLIFGSSVGWLKTYISPTNNIIINDSNTLIYRTKLPDAENYPIHEQISYISKPSDIIIDENDNISYNKEAILLNDIFLTNEMNDLYMKIISSSDLPLLAYDEDLNENQSFQEVSKIKSGDGLQKFFIMNHNTNCRYYIPYFISLFKIKKSDKFSGYVYDVDNKHFWIKLTVKKPKIEPIDIHMQILKLGDT